MTGQWHAEGLPCLLATVTQRAMDAHSLRARTCAEQKAAVCMCVRQPAGRQRNRDTRCEEFSASAASPQADKAAGYSPRDVSDTAACLPACLSGHTF